MGWRDSAGSLESEAGKTLPQLCGDYPGGATDRSAVRGTIVIAVGADIDIQTDATSRIDGRIVYLSATDVA